MEKIKYTIEIITGAGLVERTIECDYLSLKDPDRYNFMIKNEPFDCDCGHVYERDVSVGNYPRALTIIKNVEL